MDVMDGQMDGWMYGLDGWMDGWSREIYCQ